MTKLFAWGKFLKDKRVRFVFSVFIVLFIFFYLKKTGQDFNEVRSIQSPKYFFYAIPAVLVSLFLHGFAWYTILKSLGSKISLAPSIYAYYASALGRYIPGSFWYIMFRSVLGNDLGIDTKMSFLGVGIELLFTVTSGLVLIVFGILFRKITLLPEQVRPLLLFFGVTLVLLAIVFILTKVWHPKDIKVSLHKSITSSIAHTFQQVRAMATKDLILILFLFLAAWLSQGFAFFLTAHAWRQISISTLFTFVSVYSAGWLIGFINPLTPGGIGSRETIFLITLPSLLPSPIIIAVSVMMRLFGLIGEIFFALSFWLMVRKFDDK